MLKYINIILLIITTLNSTAQNNILTNAKKYISSDFSKLIFVSINNQKMYYIENDKIINTFIISSSEYGTGNKSGSNKTPLGLHKIKSKHGGKTPKNGRMIGRLFRGEIAKIYTDLSKSETDDITSRIFWLEGLEKGINNGVGIDSYKRFIYIHGTSEEGRLGLPASHGCIRMSNKEVIDLYRTIEVGTLVLIL